MNLNELKEDYGEEYPDAVIYEGKRMPLVKDGPFSGRFMRMYEAEDQSDCCMIPCFMDDAAAITAEQLKEEWPRLPAKERAEFAWAASWLHERRDFPEMVRFVMEHGGYHEWTNMALSVAGSLPCEEAFDILTRILHTIGPSHGAANVTQAIARTKHEHAEKTLRAHLEAVWNHENLWKARSFDNHVAFDAITCIANLIELGVSPADFEEQVRQLAEHPCADNQETCRNYLAQHYTWLK